MFESIAIKIALGAILAGLFIMGVKALRTLERKRGGQEEHEKAHEANDAARKRFDIATARALSSKGAVVARRMAARAARALRLRQPPDD